MSPVRSAGALVAYLGVLVMFAQSLGSSHGTLLGDLLMLGSAALLGTRQVYTALTAQSVALPKLLLTQAVVGVAFFLVVGLLLERDAWMFSQRLVFSILYQGGVIAGFGFIGNMWLLKHYLPSGVTAISLTTPVWGVLLANVVLGEALSVTLFTGLALVISGSILSQWSEARRM
jgi:drug/metabolite transporter (DMT)-like permease